MMISSLKMSSPRMFTSTSASGSASTSLERLREKDKEYKSILAKMELMGEPRVEREERQRKEAKEAQARRDKTRKANQLKGRIAFLRSRIMANPDDKGATGELSMAKCQLYWLSNPLSLD